MAIDRDLALKKAEKLLRQGKLEGAIEEYVRLVEEQPRDWNAINALGDLYLRAGNAAQAAAQFTRVADHLFTEGFLPKAAALYKKALKASPDDDATILRLADIATQQGVTADAKMFLRQLAQARRQRGDTAGATEALIKLASLDGDDGDARVAAARAAQTDGDAATAATLFRDAATAFERQEKSAEALDALFEAARLDPHDRVLRGRIARACLDAGDLERARSVLTAVIAGDDPNLLLALARIEMSGGREDRACAAVNRLLLVAPDRHPAVMELATETAIAGRADAGYALVAIVVDTAILESDLARAADVLEEFTGHVAHVPALSRLVEVCVDGDFDERMRAAQGRLADACLDAGRAAEARVIAEDLLQHDRGSAIHLQRLRRALDLLGTPDPDRIVAQCLDADAAGHDDFLDLDDQLERISVPSDDTPMVITAEMTDLDDAAIDLDEAAIELDSAVVDLPAVEPIAEIAAPGTESRLPSVEPRTPNPVPLTKDLDTVFAEMRARADQTQRAAVTTSHFDRAQRLLLEGRATAAIEELQTAARTPILRFKASAQLGRLHIERGDLDAGIEWLERAAEAPAPSEEEGVAVLYDLASALERMGEQARALAVLIELDSHVAAYRDVRDRIRLLSRAQTGTDGA